MLEIAWYISFCAWVLVGLLRQSREAQRFAFVIAVLSLIMAYQHKIVKTINDANCDVAPAAFIGRTG